jgi:hypothetical protein
MVAMAVATRGVVIRPLRRRFETRVAFEVPWERQAIFERGVVGGVEVGVWILNRRELCFEVDREMVRRRCERVATVNENLG